MDFRRHEDDGTFGRTGRRLLAVHAVLDAWCLGFAVWAADRLPERYPVHFGFSGEPDRWVTGRAEWYMLPGIAIFLSALVVGATALTARIPVEYVNMPKKRLFMVLPPAEQHRIVRMSAGFGLWVGTGVLVVLAVVQALVFQAATGQRDGLPPAVMVPLIVAVVGGAIVGAIRMTLRMRREIEDAARRHGVGGPGA